MKLKNNVMRERKSETGGKKRKSQTTKYERRKVMKDKSLA